MEFTLTTVHSSVITQTQAAEVIALCSEVFHIDYAYLMGLCPKRTHVLGYAGNSLVSHALWLERRLRVGEGPWLNAAYVEGVATHTGFRAHGYGSALMRRLQREIGSHDLGALSPAREEWYARLGWVRWQGPLSILKDGEYTDTPNDCVMVYRTPQSADIDLRARLTGEWRPFEPW
jgi:aminoglycoside 2'-N-acetyltransferase I